MHIFLLSINCLLFSTYFISFFIIKLSMLPSIEI
nr:MAG TPA: hypothetical protein [Caudoviricetes sp.]